MCALFPESGVFAPPSPFFKIVKCVREAEVLVQQQPTQGVLACDHAGPVINGWSLWQVNGRKFAHDRSFGDCAAILVPAMFGTLPLSQSRKVAPPATFLLTPDRSLRISMHPS